MYGFAAISAANGWAMAALGICIVFTALALLSFVISKLYRVLDLWEHRQDYLSKRRTTGLESSEETAALPPVLTGDLDQAARHYRLLTARLGSPFSLPRLLVLAEKTGQYRPHATLNDLIRQGWIVPDGTGLYNWKDA